MAPEPIANAYIVWALTESGVTANLDKELAALRAQSKTRKDPYFLALAGLSHLNRKKFAEGIELLQQLRDFQQKDGHIDGAQTSITASQGRDLQVETTALAILGWLRANRANDFAPNLQTATRWLVQQRRGGGSFGATQATILALKAMLEYAQKHPQAIQAGQVQMDVRTAGARDNQVPMDENFAGKNVFQEVAQAVGAPDLQRATVSPRSQETITLTLRDPACSCDPAKIRFFSA